MDTPSPKKQRSGPESKESAERADFAVVETISFDDDDWTTAAVSPTAQLPSVSTAQQPNQTKAEA